MEEVMGSETENLEMSVVISSLLSLGCMKKRWKKLFFRLWLAGVLYFL